MDLIAFVTRSGNQQYHDMMDTPIDELTDYANALERLLKREAQAFKDASSGH